MRIITGSARGRRLVTPEGLDVRPTPEKVKEALFSALQFDIEGRRILDLFAGSGQLGLEALSRGIPVIVTENVGAKDLIKQGEQGFIIAPCKESLMGALEQILSEPELLQRMNECIVKMNFPYTMQIHAEEIFAKIYG